MGLPGTREKHRNTLAMTINVNQTYNKMCPWDGDSSEGMGLFRSPGDYYQTFDDIAQIINGDKDVNTS